MSFNVGDKLKHKTTGVRTEVVGKTAQHYQIKLSAGKRPHMRKTDVEENYELIKDEA